MVGVWEGETLLQGCQTWEKSYEESPHLTGNRAHGTEERVGQAYEQREVRPESLPSL